MIGREGQKSIKVRRTGAAGRKGKRTEWGIGVVVAKSKGGEIRLEANRERLPAEGVWVLA